MKPITLDDLCPTGSQFSLARTGKSYRLKPFSLRDELWLKDEFGADIQTIFDQQDMPKICRIVFHQMEEEDKADFRAQEVTLMNEEGETIKEKIGGYKLLFGLVQGTTEKVEMLYALVETIGISRQMVEEIGEQLAKKNADAPDKPGIQKKKKRSTGR